MAEGGKAFEDRNMNSLVGHFYKAVAGAWDEVTLNSARIERGMEKASAGFLAGPPVLAGFFGHQVYQEDGIGGLGYIALSLVAYYVGMLAIKSRTEIRQFDKKKQEELVATALKFYDANKGTVPSPR